MTSHCLDVVLSLEAVAMATLVMTLRCLILQTTIIPMSRMASKKSEMLVSPQDVRNAVSGIRL